MSIRVGGEDWTLLSLEPSANGASEVVATVEAIARRSILSRLLLTKPRRRKMAFIGVDAEWRKLPSLARCAEEWAITALVAAHRTGKSVQ